MDAALELGLQESLVFSERVCPMVQVCNSFMRSYRIDTDRQV